ncbi:MAG: oligopeptide:H+ symporter [Victivallales bacterium]|nr:oligopeptide:H+ symporter [Victivallales bacterium]
MTEKSAHVREGYPGKPIKPFSLIFFMELWERYGFYSMQYLLVYFMIKELSFGDADADNTFAAFTALAYAFLIAGGYIGDKILGNKRTMFLGAIVLASGYLYFSINPLQNIYWGLGLIIAGNALFKANPSTLVSKLYSPDDPRLDGSYTLYYMSINIGSLVGSFLSPVVAAVYGWGVAFFLSFLGLLTAIVAYIIFHGLLNGIASEAGKQKMKFTALVKAIAVGALITVLSAYLLRHLTVTHIILYLAIILAVIYIFFQMLKLKPGERSKFFVCFVLICQAVVFYALYQQRATSLNLFVVRNTIHSVFGITLNPLQFQSFNPFWILLASPILAWYFTKMARAGKDLALPTKFAWGMLLSSSGFLIIKFAAYFFANKNGLVPGEWIFIAIGFLSVGEILIGGIGLSMVAKLVPQRIMGAMMGVWFMATAAAMILGGFIAAYASIPEGVKNPVKTLPIYTNLFFELGLVTFIIAVIMFITAPTLKKFIS